jgi:mannose-6-phosphate isomerase class I
MQHASSEAIPEERIVDRHEMVLALPKLDFLLKVLSIRTALCVQAHPDQKLARQLHSDSSLRYPGACKTDGNLRRIEDQKDLINVPCDG